MVELLNNRVHIANRTKVLNTCKAHFTSILRVFGCKANVGCIRNLNNHRLEKMAHKLLQHLNIVETSNQNLEQWVGSFSRLFGVALVEGFTIKLLDVDLLGNVAFKLLLLWVVKAWQNELENHFNFELFTEKLWFVLNLVLDEGKKAYQSVVDDGCRTGFWACVHAHLVQCFNRQFKDVKWKVLCNEWQSLLSVIVVADEVIEQIEEFLGVEAALLSDCCKTFHKSVQEELSRVHRKCILLHFMCNKFNGFFELNPEHLVFWQ